MSKLPYFKFYPQDFIVGTSFMTPSEVGGYIRLLCTEWENGGIPRNEKLISRITGCEQEECLNILKKFEVVEDKYYNKRLESERNDLIHKSIVNTNNAKLRWEQNANAMQPQCERISERICETVCENDAYQKSEVRSQNTEVKSYKSEDKDNILSEKSDEININEFDKFWNMYPKERKDKKKQCLDFFKKLSKEKVVMVVQALEKYLKSERVLGKYIKLSIYWLRDWETWLDYEPEIKGRSLL